MLRNVLCLAVLVFVLSCSNDKYVAPQQRTIRFELFTDQDFSQDSNSIIFMPSVSAGNTVLWDSTFNAMLIKDIPGGANKIVFEKKIDATSELKAGFRYSIENVGISWHYEQVLTSESSKVISFNFK